MSAASKSKLTLLLARLRPIHSLHSLRCFPLSHTRFPPIQLSHNRFQHTQRSIMSFETTGTIATFGGKLLKLKHKSSSTNTDMELNVFLPPQALKSGAKVPVLFYLSGLTCTGNNCSEKGFFQHGASKHGIAVVYPDTSPRACLPSVFKYPANTFGRRAAD
jgi:poly(3-hydroxybutyrate) depolymerase